MPDHITGTLVESFLSCKRQAWLMAHELNPRQDFEFLELGRLVHEESYKRTSKEVIVGNMRLDLIREKNGKILVGEVKKSSHNLSSAIMQLCFYLNQLNDFGVEATGQLFFPEERKKLLVELTSERRQQLDEVLSAIQSLMASPSPPPYVHGKFCTHCAYFEFCAS
jgi:CRISPR-associated exonuclease Cas4